MEVCRKGLHPDTPENTVTNARTGKRRCRECLEEWKRNHVTPECSIRGCKGRVRARTWCGKHYEAWRTHGDPLGAPAQDRSDLDGEEWRPVRGWRDLYEVSSLGRVWSIRSRRLLKLRPGSYGYLEVSLCRNRTRAGGKQVTVPVHRLVAAAFLGPKPPKQGVRHLDGNQLNNAARNLRYGTQRQNLEDSVWHGTALAVQRAERTSCKNGHDYLPGSFYYNADGARVCRTCDREKFARYAQKRKARRQAALTS